MRSIYKLGCGAVQIPSFRLMGVYLLFFFFSLFASPDDHFQKAYPHRPETCVNPFKSIDFIYLINLDQRPEKLQKSEVQLAPFGVVPYRFSAVYGWALSPQAINDLGLVFSPEMQGGQWVYHYPLSGSEPELCFLSEMSEKKVYYPLWMSRGAMGCALSHLSILKDAYQSGYETIWVMEDDIFVTQPIDVLSRVIEKLDCLVGKTGWDILYTDNDQADFSLYSLPNDFESDLRGSLWFLWRPDRMVDEDRLRKRVVLSEDFVQIGSRMRTHSMIIRKSGMKKILDYVKAHGIFTPYDHELALIPNMRLFNLRYPIVTFWDQTSDTREKHF